jgi:phosphoribosylanthranilate isomerase
MNKDLKIKVCGMRDLDNIKAVAQLDINMMGFIFYPKSPRFVRMISSLAGIMPDYSEEQLKRQTGKETETPIHRNIERVGVFADDMPQNIVTRVYNYRLDYVQLHGDENPIMIENLKRTLVPDIVPKIKIIKTLSISSPEDLEAYKSYEGHVDLFLFDTKCPSKGGSGHQFDWTILDGYHGQTPFLLSGGIGPDDVEAIKSFHHPQCIGIDVNSKFETEPGVKDVERLSKFIDQLRS